MSEILYPAETEVVERGVRLTLHDSDGRSTERVVDAPFTHADLLRTVDDMARVLATV